MRFSKYEKAINESESSLAASRAAHQSAVAVHADASRLVEQLSERLAEAERAYDSDPTCGTEVLKARDDLHLAEVRQRKSSEHEADARTVLREAELAAAHARDALADAELDRELTAASERATEARGHAERARDAVAEFDLSIVLPRIIAATLQADRAARANLEAAEGKARAAATAVEALEDRKASRSAIYASELAARRATERDEALRRELDTCIERGTFPHIRRTIEEEHAPAIVAIESVLRAVVDRIENLVQGQGVVLDNATAIASQLGRTSPERRIMPFLLARCYVLLALHAAAGEDKSVGTWLCGFGDRDAIGTWGIQHMMEGGPSSSEMPKEELAALALSGATYAEFLAAEKTHKELKNAAYQSSDVALDRRKSAITVLLRTGWGDKGVLSIERTEALEREATALGLQVPPRNQRSWQPRDLWELRDRLKSGRRSDGSMLPADDLSRLRTTVESFG